MSGPSNYFNNSMSQPQVSSQQATALMSEASARINNGQSSLAQDSAMDISEMGGGSTPVGPPTLDQLVANIDKTLHGQKSLDPGSYLPSFKKGSLVEKVAADVLNKFVNRAAILLDKIRMAEKILRELNAHTQLGYWGHPVINPNRVSLSRETTSTLNTQFDTLLISLIREDKVKLITECNKELTDTLPTSLHDHLRSLMTSVDTNIDISGAGKNYTYKLIKATAEEFSAQVDTLRATAEFGKLSLGLKVIKHLVCAWFVPRIYIILQKTFLYELIHPKYLLENQEDIPERLRKEQTIPFTSNKRTFQVQRSQETYQGEEHSEERYQTQGPSSQGQNYVQETVHVKQRKKQRLRKEVLSQEEIRKHDKDTLNGVNNISSITNIPYDILCVLNKGVNFNIHKQPRYDLLTLELKKLRSALCKKVNKKDISTVNILFEAYKPRLISEFANLRKSNPHTKLLPKIKKTINFMTRHNLLIGPADKNLGLTIMDKTWYQNHLSILLQQKKCYIENPHYSIHDIVNDLRRFKQPYYKQLFGEDLLDLIHSIEKKSRIPGYYRVPVMYLLPKIHKSPFGVRPIVPSFPWVTHSISEFVDRELRNVVARFCHDLPDTPTLIRILENFEFDNHYDYFILSYDVINMYGNIDDDEAVDTIRTFFEGDAEENKIFSLLRLAQWVNGNCILSDGDKEYRQIKGLAMGTPMAPTIARLFACCIEGEPIYKSKPIDQVFIDTEDGNFEEEDFLTNLTITVQIFRYIDDGLAIAAIPRFQGTFTYNSTTAIEILRNCDIVLNNIYANCNSINITIDHLQNGRQAVMLDLLISIVDEGYNIRFDITPYDKPMNKHLYTDPETYYPPRYIFNWINGENQRLIRNSSNSTSHKAAQEKFINFLIHRGYSEHVIKEQLQLHTYDDRHQLLYGDHNNQEQETNNIKFYLNNIPGRDKVEYFGRSVIRNTMRLKPNTYENMSVTWVTYRGSNLRDELNKYNRKILQSSTMRPKL